MKRPDPAVPVAPTPWGPSRGSSDPFVAARTAYWKRTTGPLPGWRAASPHLFAELVRAEYRPDDAPTGRTAGATSTDLALAGLRRRIRAGDAPPPERCVRLLTAGDHARSAVFDAWPETVRRHGTARSAAAVRHGLRGTRCPHTVAILLDLAAAESLVPVARPELLRLAHTHDRAVRHAAWRLLATYDGPLILPGADADTPPRSRSADVYERLLREALQAPATPEARGLRPGMLVAQSMLMGRLDRPGEGLSGGLGVLLGSLGDALAETDHVAGVLTVVTACVPELEADPALLHRRGRRHWVLRLPVDSPRQVRPEELGRHREPLAWWATRLLGSLGRPVDVLHVRYADDGSLALAEAARRSGATLAFTAAPDPHRQMAERHDVPDADPKALRQDLHRVFVADRLIDRADRVVGIAGPEGGVDELLLYFPQLADGADGSAPDAPPEGIPPYRPPADAVRRVESVLARVEACFDATGGSVRPHTPTVLLSVGRLHPVKQQDVLVRAWIESGAFRESVLVCVGGSPSDDDPAERVTRAGIDRAVAAFPDAADRLILLPALANVDVRTLERRLADPSSGFRARYVCPSAKEEFGLAVLEAMEAGLLVAGPLRGGVPHYLVDGRNGLLIDTSCARTLGEGLRRLLRVDDEEAAAMARSAQDLVRSTYSSNAMAQALVGHYLAIARCSPPRAGEHRDGAVRNTPDPPPAAGAPAGRRIRIRHRRSGGGAPLQTPGRAGGALAGRNLSPLVRVKGPSIRRAAPNEKT